MCEIVTFLYNLYDPYKWIHSYTIRPLNIMLISAWFTFSFYILSLDIFFKRESQTF